jgi:hypothetical protein
VQRKGGRICLTLCRKHVIKAKDGREFLVRRPTLGDAKSLTEYINSLVEEGAQIVANKKLTLKEEKEWLRNGLRKIKEGKLHQLVIEDKGRIVGIGVYDCTLVDNLILQNLVYPSLKIIEEWV